MTWNECIESLNKVTEYVETIAKGFLKANQVEDAYESIIKKAQCHQCEDRPSLEEKLKYVDSITNGVVELVSKRTNKSIEEVREQFVRYYSCEK